MQLKLDPAKIGKSPKRPIQVYLDSNDYSDLSKAMNDPRHPYVKIFEGLCSYVDRGKIEIRFSPIHIIEMAHIDARSKDAALVRARCLKRLTDGKCFRYWDEAIAFECRDFIDGMMSFESVTNDNAVWHPDISIVARSMKQTFADEAKKCIADSGSNRHQRRMLERQYFPNGQLSRKSVNFLKASQRELLMKKMSQDFPVGERMWREDMMLKYVVGEVSAAEIVYEMGVVLRDVETFIGWTHETRGRKLHWLSWLRDFGRELNAKVETLREDYDRSIRPYMEPDQAKSKMRQVLENRMPEMREGRLSRVREGALELETPIDITDGKLKKILASPLGSIPLLDSHLFFFCEYFSRNVRMDRKTEPSDAADLHHMAYMPYCDFFRADTDAADFLKQYAKLMNVTVVPRLRELPKLIDDELKKRAA